MTNVILSPGALEVLTAAFRTGDRVKVCYGSPPRELWGKVVCFDQNFLRLDDLPAVLFWEWAQIASIERVPEDSSFPGVEEPEQPAEYAEWHDILKYNCAGVGFYYTRKDNPNLTKLVAVSSFDNNCFICRDYHRNEAFEKVSFSDVSDISLLSPHRNSVVTNPAKMYETIARAIENGHNLLVEFIDTPGFYHRIIPNTVSSKGCLNYSMYVHGYAWSLDKSTSFIEIRSLSVVS